MNLLNTSKDALNLAIAVSVIGFTAFVCWSIYYFARIMQQLFQIIKEMRDRLHKIDELIKSLKEKIESSVSYLLLIGEGVKKLVEVIKNVSDSKKEKSNSREE
jgi:predicted PurR-regulated permease PerM